MARPTAPLLSLSASGTLAHSLIYSNWKGRPYTKRRVTPRDPRTVPQLASRALMRFLQFRWPGLTSAQLATWDAHPDRQALSRYHCFLKYNADRWAHYKGPSAAYPASLALPEADYSSGSSTAAVRQCGFWCTDTVPARSWALILFRTTNPAGVRHPSAAVLWIPVTTAALWHWDVDVIPGTTYYYTRTMLSMTGRLKDYFGPTTLTPLP